MGKFCKYFKNIIKFCDFFGTFITFRIKDEIEYKSLIGGLISIIVFTLGTLYTIYVAIPFITRQNIDFIFSYKIVESQPFINLTDVKFNLAFGIQYQDNAISAISAFDKYFNYSIKLNEWIGIDNIKEFSFGLKNCTHSDFYNLVNDSFDLNQLNTMICPILNNSVNLTLDGLFTDYYYKYIELEIRLTEYGMDNFDSLKNIIQKNPIEMSVFFLDAAIHYQNRNKPLLIYINYLNKGIDISLIKKTNVFISTVEFTNDDNLFYKDENKIIESSFDKTEDSFHLVSSRTHLNENLVGKFIIEASSKILVMERKYQKLPSFIAELTGILQELLLIILYVINIIERQAIDNKLIHKMLKIKGSKYYDIDYYVNIFNRDKVNNDIMSIIKKGNLNVEKKGNGGLYCKRKSVMTLLENKKINNNNQKTNNSDFINTKSYFNKRNNYLDNNDYFKTIEINTPNLNDNDNKVQISEREMVNFFNSPNNKKKRNIKNYKKYNEESSFSISSISSKDINTIDKKKKKTSQIESINYSEEKEETNTNNILNSKRELMKNLNNNNDDLNYDINSSKIENIKQDINDNKKAEEDFANMNVVSSVFSKIFFWISKYQRRKNELLKLAEGKIHYYLEIFNYIKGMQEIDLLKYCLFDKEQINLFEFLACPPFKTNTNQYDGIYKEFENKQVIFNKIRKKEINNVYHSYNLIRSRNDITFEDLKLLRLVNAEVGLLS